MNHYWLNSFFYHEKVVMMIIKVKFILPLFLFLLHTCFFVLKKEKPLEDYTNRSLALDINWVRGRAERWATTAVVLEFFDYIFMVEHSSTKADAIAFPLHLPALFCSTFSVYI
jgi:hypothetical protein